MLFVGASALLLSPRLAPRALATSRVPSRALNLRGGAPAAALRLYCKPSRDGTAVGDCPFCHSVRMTLELKGVAYEVLPTTPAQKPDWLLERHAGSMPCLHDPASDESIADSAAIAASVDERYATPDGGAPLGAPPNDAALAATAPFFKALAGYVKNTDDSRDAELRDALCAVIDSIEARACPSEDWALPCDRAGHAQAYMRDAGSPDFLGGAQPGLADCNFAPKLHVMRIAAAHFKVAAAPPQPGSCLALPL